MGGGVGIGVALGDAMGDGDIAGVGDTDELGTMDDEGTADDDGDAVTCPTTVEDELIPVTPPFAVPAVPPPAPQPAVTSVIHAKRARSEERCVIGRDRWPHLFFIALTR